MGYYTDFSIQLIGEDIDEAKVEEVRIELEKVSEYTFYRDVFKEIKSEDTFKWYEHEEHLKILAITYPDICFIVKGIGEEQPDMWIKYFKGNNFKYAKGAITYPEPPPWTKK